jgi:hypothetical protein
MRDRNAAHRTLGMVASRNDWYTLVEKRDHTLLCLGSRLRIFAANNYTDATPRAAWTSFFGDPHLQERTLSTSHSYNVTALTSRDTSWPCHTNASLSSLHKVPYHRLVLDTIYVLI